MEEMKVGEAMMFSQPGGPTFYIARLCILGAPNELMRNKVKRSKKDAK
jgi:hypothetical protein